ncbi:MAG: hypothetical protein JSV89_03725 [Spirochaetaceae bacterium]|nr:MAG: hypothetical protein JSV89_03725 [Spirochaetaceae bacterium]
MIRRCLLVLVILLCAVFTVTAGGAGETSTTTEAESRYGGTLNIAVARTLVHLDPDKTTDGATGQVVDHMLEGLVEIDETFSPVPCLAESFEMTPDGKTYTFKLRQGVPFHNGKEMTSEDVVASMNRWFLTNGGGKSVAKYVDGVAAPGPYEVIVKFKEPYAPFLSFLSSIVANQKLRIRPKEIVEKYGEEVIEEPIGTGPYQLVEWIPDQHVKMKRFEQYASPTGPSSGYSGAKMAYADELIFMFVPEQAVRTAGVQTGQYHFAEQVPRDQYDMFATNPEVQLYMISPNQQGFVIINKGTPPFDNLYARQALLYGLNLEELGLAAIGPQKFWFLDASLFPPGNRWYDANAGKGIYNNYDPDKARELLKKSGYDGSTIIILNGRDDPTETRTALTIKEQLEKLGFSVDAQLYDRATVVKQRSTKDGWNLHVSQFFTPDPDPQVYGAWMGTNKWIGNWDDQYSRQIDAVFDRMVKEPNFEKRYKIVQEWYAAFFELVPYVKLYYFNNFHLGNKSLKGFQTFTRWFFYNCWIEE